MTLARILHPQFYVRVSVCTEQLRCGPRSCDGTGSPFVAPSFRWAFLDEPEIRLKTGATRPIRLVGAAQTK
jgi:hypothetical protein